MAGSSLPLPPAITSRDEGRRPIKAFIFVGYGDARESQLLYHSTPRCVKYQSSGSEVKMQCHFDRVFNISEGGEEAGLLTA
jgi:hypothetical protein